MKSGELALEPAPLSVRIQNDPSAMRLMPEWPWMGWPWNGSGTPVSRPPDWPITLPTASTRRGVVNLPATCRSCGASLGAAIIVRAGSTAWPGSVAGEGRDMFMGNKAKTRTMPRPCDATMKGRHQDMPWDTADGHGPFARFESHTRLALPHPSPPTTLDSTYSLWTPFLHCNPSDWNCPAPPTSRAPSCLA